MRFFGKLAPLVVVTLSFAASACTVETLVPGSGEPETSRPNDDPATGSTPSAEPPASTAPTTSPADAPEAQDGSARVDLRVSGDCAPELRDLVVSTNVQSYDSLAVTNASAPNEGSFQIQLVSAKRDLTLSTAERTEARDVINLTAGGVVYTNLCNPSGGCSFDPQSKTWRNDPVAGKVAIKAYAPRKGTLDVTLDGVVLASTRGAGICRLHGTVKTMRLGR